MYNYYEVDLADSRNYDYTLGGTVSIAVISNRYPKPEEIEKYLDAHNHRLKHLKVCFISDPLKERESEDIAPFMADSITLIDDD